MVVDKQLQHHSVLLLLDRSYHAFTGKITVYCNISLPIIN